LFDVSVNVVTSTIISLIFSKQKKKKKRKKKRKKVLATRPGRATLTIHTFF